MPFGDDVRQQVILELMKTGSIDDAIDALKRAKMATDDLAKSTYELEDVSKTYEVLTSKVNNFATADLNAILKAEAARQRANQAADAWMNKQIGDLDAVIDAMHEYEQAADAMTATELRNYTAVASASGAIGKATTVNRAYGTSLMSVAYALDDVRYGFGAIINNIPMLAMAAGANAQWAAGISIAAIGVYELGKALAPLIPQTETLVKTVEELEKRLKELEGIKVKTEINYIDITNARRELMRLKEEESSYNRLKGQKTEEQEKRGRVVSEAIVESGGGDDYTSSIENITQAIIDKMAADSPEVQKQKAYIAERMARVGNRNIPLAIQARAEREAEGARDILNQHMLGISQTATRITGGAAAGRSLETGQLAAFVAGNEGTLAARGVDTLRLGAGLENAQKANLFADERRKIQKERDDFARKKLEQSIDERNDSEERSIEAGQEQGRKNDREAEAENLWQMGINDWIKQQQGVAGRKSAAEKKRADAEKARTLKGLARGAPKRALEGQQDFYGKQFQQVTGVNDLRAEQAGKDIAAQVNKGASPARAAGATLQKMLAEMAQLGEINRQQQAELLQFYGFFDQATRVMQAQNRGMMQNQPRRTIRPTRSPNIQR